MGKRKKFHGKVVGKWIKGLIFKTPMLSIEFINSEPRYNDYPVKMAFWNAVEKGDMVHIEMEQSDKDNLWYQV